MVNMDQDWEQVFPMRARVWFEIDEIIYNDPLTRKGFVILKEFVR